MLTVIGRVLADFGIVSWVSIVVESNWLVFLKLGFFFLMSLEKELLVDGFQLMLFGNSWVLFEEGLCMGAEIS
jgi:hypothetical protein